LCEVEADDQIVAWSSLARKEGLLGLEAIADNEQEVFARKGLQLLVDGNEPEIIRECLEVDLETKEYSDFQAAKVFESLGGNKVIQYNWLNSTCSRLTQRNRL
jgi:chemotaxis protein MotA